MTDFGLRDHYVAAMKGAVLGRCPIARLIDITHYIPPQDVLAGTFVLERAVASFPAGTIHVAVVDPGVGTPRPLLLVEANHQHILCPDNGLITWTWRRYTCRARLLSWRPARASATFHGRDILAPAAAMLAAGEPPDTLAGEGVGPRLFDLHLADPHSGRGQIIHIDHFGNCTTNLPAHGLAGNVRVRDHDLGPIRHTYGDVTPGQPLALIGSSDLLEIAVRDGSAERVLGLAVGDEVRVE